MAEENQTKQHTQSVRLNPDRRGKLACYAADKTRELSRAISFNEAINLMIDEFLPDPDASPSPNPSRRSKRPKKNA